MHRFCLFFTLFLTGCALPGFSLSGTVTLPPTVMGTNTVAAMPTQSMPTYAIETTQTTPVITRSFSTIPAMQQTMTGPVMPQPPIRAELIGPPRDCGKPCP